MALEGEKTNRQRGYTTFFMLRMKFIMLINVKMPTLVGILTFISMINRTARQFFITYVYLAKRRSGNGSTPFIRPSVRNSFEVPVTPIFLVYLYLNFVK